HNDFRRFDQSSRRNQWITLLIKLDAAKGAKTTIPVAQIELVMLIVPHYRGYQFLLGATTSIQHVYPFQYLPEVAGVRACITDHTTTEGAGDARAKFESPPAKRGQLVQ